MDAFTDFLDKDTGRVHWTRRHLARSKMIDILAAVRADIMKRLA